MRIYTALHVTFLCDLGNLNLHASCDCAGRYVERARSLFDKPYISFPLTVNLETTFTQSLIVHIVVDSALSFVRLVTIHDFW